MASLVQEQTPMQKLSGQYYNTLNQQLAGPKERLQVHTPFKPLQNDKDLANSADAVPQYGLLTSNPRDVMRQDSKLTPSRRAINEEVDLTAGFKSVYSSLLADVRTPTDSKFHLALKGYWDEWNKFSKAWAKENRKPRMSAECVQSYLNEEYSGPNPGAVQAAFQQDRLTPVVKAADLIGQWDVAGNKGWADFYNTSYQNTLRASSGQQLKVSFNSETANSDVNHSWTGGSMGVRYNYFSASGEASYEKLSTKVAGSKIEFELKIAGYTTVPVRQQRSIWFWLPLLVQARNPDLKGDMFDSDAKYSEHFRNEERDALSWGDLVWFTDELVVGKGLELTMSIFSHFEEHEESTFKSRASAGFWPFFSISAGHSEYKGHDKVGKDRVQVVMATDPEQLIVLATKVGKVFEM